MLMNWLWPQAAHLQHTAEKGCCKCTEDEATKQRGSVVTGWTPVEPVTEQAVGRASPRRLRDSGPSSVHSGSEFRSRSGSTNVKWQTAEHLGKRRSCVPTLGACEPAQAVTASQGSGEQAQHKTKDDSGLRLESAQSFQRLNFHSTS